MKKTCLLGLALMISFELQAQSTNYPVVNNVAPQLSGTGTPSSNALACSASSYSNVSYIQTDATNGRLWLCDQSSGSWAWDHVPGPTAVGVTGVIGGSSLIALGCTTGTVTIAGATVGVNAAFAAPLSNPGSGLLIISAYVSAANTITVSVCNLSASLLTPSATAYKVLMY